MEANEPNQSAFEALQADKIFHYLDDLHQIRADQIYISPQLGSTNNWLLEQIQQQAAWRVCLAEQQTAGRGRNGRTWQAAAAPQTNIYLTFGYPIPLTLDQHNPPNPAQTTTSERPQDNNLASLTLVMGIAAVGALQHFGVNQPLFLKWPNDIYLADGKLAGILVETMVVQQVKYLVVGIGLNLVPPPACGRKTASLSDCLPSAQLIERNRLVGFLLDQMLAACHQYLQSGFAPWQSVWNSLDYLAGRQIQVEISGGHRLTGRESGVDEQGRLLLQLAQDPALPPQIRAIDTGEIIL